VKRPTHLRSVAVTAADPAGLASFYEDIWGLMRVAEQDGVIYLRGIGGEHHILAIHPARVSSVRSISLGLPDRDAVDEAARDLGARAGITIVRPPSELDQPGGGYGLSIADVDGRMIELSADVVSPPPPAPASPILPTKISHVVVNSPRADACAELLTDVLGFTLADELPHMLFFRCNADHHSIAVTRAPHASLNHIAFEVPTTDDVLAGIDHLQRHDYATIWGPGRHGPGHNVFAYFVAPNAQVVEYTAEVDQIDDDNPPAPRLWRPEDTTLSDTWADPASLRPTAEARQAMLGEPEPVAAGGRP
jgi:catechol 2,3-dioxygenase-like lactoylglutathione lyase family enzyme